MLPAGQPQLCQLVQGGDAGRQADAAFHAEGQAREARQLAYVWVEAIDRLHLQAKQLRGSQGCPAGQPHTVIEAAVAGAEVQGLDRCHAACHESQQVSCSRLQGMPL